MCCLWGLWPPVFAVSVTLFFQFTCACNQKPARNVQAAGRWRWRFQARPGGHNHHDGFAHTSLPLSCGLSADHVNFSSTPMRKMQRERVKAQRKPRYRSVPPPFWPPQGEFANLCWYPPHASLPTQLYASLHVGFRAGTPDCEWWCDRKLEANESGGKGPEWAQLLTPHNKIQIVFQFY